MRAQGLETTLQRCSVWFTIVLAAGFSLAAGAPVARASIDDGLVAHYALDGNGNDSGSNGYHGTVVGAVPAPDRLGNPASALEFDGVDDRVIAGNLPTFASGDSVTLSVWAKPHSLTTYWGNADMLVHLGEEEGKPGDYNYYLRYHTERPEFGFLGPITAANVWNTDATYPDTSGWQHIAVVFTYGDASSIRMYYDGALVAGSWVSGSNGDNPPYQPSPTLLAIGAYQEFGTNYQQFFHGLIDEVRIYSRRLEPCEVRELAGDSCGPPSEEGLVAHYPLDGNTTDVSGHEHHGGPTQALTIPDRCGAPGAALSFDGNDFIEIPHSTDFQVQYVSISAWVSPVFSSQERTVFTTDSCNRGYFLNVTPSSLWFSVGDGSWHHLNAPYALPQGEWSHLAGTFDGASLTLYVDGALVGQTNWTGQISSGTRNPQIGRNGCYPSRLDHYFMGGIDDVRIYDRGLSPREVIDLASQSCCGDGIVGLGEECDDGNQDDGDGCSATCKKELIPVVIIPGILGSELYLDSDDSCSLDPTQDELLWVDEKILNFDVLWLPELARPWPPPTEEEPSPCPLPEGTLLVGDILRTDHLEYLPGDTDAYSGIIETLYEAGYREGSTLFTHGYDWRRSVRDAASQLCTRLLESGGGEGPPATVDVVAHSLGGLVARQFALGDCPVSVRRMIFLGTPQSGAAVMYQTLLRGLTSPGWLDRDWALNNVVVAEVARTWQSAYELLPTDLYSNRHGSFLRFKPDPLAWGARRWVDVPLNALYGEFPDDLPDGFPPAWTVGGFADSGARQMHEGLGTELGQPTQYSALITGSALDTVAGYKMKDGKAGVHLSPIRLDGDGTVPLASHTEFSYDASYYAYALEHGQYLKDVVESEEVRQLIVDLLAAEDPGSVERFPYPLPDIPIPVGTLFRGFPWSYDKGILLWTGSDAELHVYDTHGNHSGPIGEAIDQRIPGATYLQFENNAAVMLQSGDHYEIVLRGSKAGEFSVFAEVPSLGGEIHTYARVGVPTAPESVAQLDISADGIMSNLEVDADGDGMPDMIYGWEELPAFTSTPETTVIPDDGFFSYVSEAEEPFEGAVVYSLPVGPAGMTIDAETGLVTWTPSSGQCGNHVVTLGVLGAGGGSDEQTFDLSVLDVTSPLLACSPPQLLECGGESGTVADFSTFVADKCSADLEASCLPSAGSAFYLGSTLVTCTAVDESGNSGACSFHVIVTDTTGPELTCPAPQQLECTAEGGAAAVFAASASDICFGELEAACVPSSGSVFALGETPIACDVTDGAGNSAACDSSVMVADTMPPSINSFIMVPDVLWPPNHKMVEVAPVTTVTDVCDTAPVIELISITMNEGDETLTYDPMFDNTQGDGHTIDDIEVDEEGRILLRAERSGGGDGRVYEITYSATDASGNAATASATVTVPHNR